MIENPYGYAASEVLRQLDPNLYTTRTQLGNAVQVLAAVLGTPANISQLDPGTQALVLFCTFLREHGASIAAVTKAHSELHQP